MNTPQPDDDDFEWGAEVTHFGQFVQWSDIEDWLPVVKRHYRNGVEAAQALEMAIRHRFNYTEIGDVLKCGPDKARHRICEGYAVIAIAMFGRLPPPYLEPEPLGIYRGPVLLKDDKNANAAA